MKYCIIGDEDSVLGFGLVGVRGFTVRTAEEAKEAFQGALADRELGIIIMTERTAELIRGIVNRFIFKESFPLIVEIPDRKGPLPGRKGIRERVNAAIGVSL